MPRPSCFGNYQGRDGNLTLEPIGECRRCQPFRRCREKTQDAFIEAFRGKILDGEKPPCWGHYPSGDWVCKLCPLSNHDQCQGATRQRDHEEHVQKKEKKELTFIQRLRAKTKDAWGDND